MERIQKLQRLLKQKHLPALLVSDPYNVRYLCGYIGTNGRLLLTGTKATLITDFRYLRSARKQMPKQVAIFDQKHGIKKLLGKFKTLGIEQDHLTHAQFKALQKALPKTKLQLAGGLVEELRLIKEPGEIKIMRTACAMADECLKRLVRTIRVGVSEDDLEWNLLRFARELGADGFSFPPIICFGKNTADVHHIKELNRLKKGEAILIDMGISYRGYMTDMTRTFYTRKPSNIEQKIYTTVLEANERAIAAIKVGKKLSDIDKVARDHIRKAGYAKYFGHSTGHGVGLKVHEAPSVSENSEDVVKPGMVFTIEPGIYLNHLGGVRIEDMVYVNERGQVEVLTKFEKHGHLEIHVE